MVVADELEQARPQQVGVGAHVRAPQPTPDGVEQRQQQRGGDRVLAGDVLGQGAGAVDAAEQDPQVVGGGVQVHAVEEARELGVVGEPLGQPVTEGAELVQHAEDGGHGVVVEPVVVDEVVAQVRLHLHRVVVGDRQAVLVERQQPTAVDADPGGGQQVAQGRTGGVEHVGVACQRLDDQLDVVGRVRAVGEDVPHRREVFGQRGVGLGRGVGTGQLHRPAPQSRHQHRGVGQPPVRSRQATVAQVAGRGVVPVQGQLERVVAAQHQRGEVRGGHHLAGGAFVVGQDVGEHGAIDEVVEVHQAPVD